MSASPWPTSGKKFESQFVLRAIIIYSSRKAKTRRGKRFLENRQPKVIENDKMALIIKGGKTNEKVTSALADLYALKKPLALHLKRYLFRSNCSLFYLSSFIHDFGQF